METAAKVLIVGGLGLLAYGFVTGYVLGAVRARQAEGPKYLVLAHTEPLMQGIMLLALVWAVQLSDLDGSIETAAAAGLVAAAALQGGKELLNWLQGVGDEFQERPIGYWIARVQSTVASLSLVTLLVGAIAGL